MNLTTPRKLLKPDRQHVNLLREQGAFRPPEGTHKESMTRKFTKHFCSIALLSLVCAASIAFADEDQEQTVPRMYGYQNVGLKSEDAINDDTTGDITTEVPTDLDGKQKSDTGQVLKQFGEIMHSMNDSAPKNPELQATHNAVQTMLQQLPDDESQEE
jgi:hypothetical protein